MEPSRIVMCLVCFVSILYEAHGEFVRVCYFTSWSRHRVSPLAKYDVNNIDPTICSHLIYAFANIEDTTIVAAETGEEGTGGRFSQFNNLKLQSPDLKTLLSVGGEHSRTEQFRHIIATEENRGAFANSSAEYLVKHGFDGLDLDWEYPAGVDKANFTLFLQTMRQVYDSTTPRLLLTAATSALADTVDAGYDVKVLNSALDMVLIMTYDYHGQGWSKVAAFSAPLYSRPTFWNVLSVDYTVHYYNKLGLSYDKMVVGVTSAFHHFKLKDAAEYAVGSPVLLNNTEVGPLFKIKARIAYTEICIMRKENGSHVYFDDVQKQNFLVNNLSWIGFEDPATARLKVKFIQNLGVAGIMFWALDYDDFTGEACNNGSYPILSAMLDEAGVVRRSTVPPASTTTPVPPTGSPVTPTTNKTEAPTTKKPDTDTTNKSVPHTTSGPPQQTTIWGPSDDGSSFARDLFTIKCYICLLTIFRLFL